MRHVNLAWRQQTLKAKSAQRRGNRAAISALAAALTLTFEGRFNRDYGRYMDGGMIELKGGEHDRCVAVLVRGDDEFKLGAIPRSEYRLSNFAALGGGVVYSLWAQPMAFSAPESEKLRVCLTAEQALRVRQNPKEVPGSTETGDASKPRMWYQLREYRLPLGRLFREVEDKGVQAAKMMKETDKEYSIKFEVDVDKMLASQASAVRATEEKKKGFESLAKDDIWVTSKSSGRHFDLFNMGRSEIPGLELAKPWTWLSTTNEWTAFTLGAVSDAAWRQCQSGLKLGRAMSSAVWEFNHHHVMLMRQYMPKKDQMSAADSILGDERGQIVSKAQPSTQQMTEGLIKRAEYLATQAAQTVHSNAEENVVTDPVSNPVGEPVMESAGEAVGPVVEAVIDSA